MIDRLLQIVAPHYCYGCGEAGAMICANCKYDIIQEGFSACVACGAPSTVGICSACKTSYEKAWCVGSRSGVLAETIDAYKFRRARAAHHTLASLLDETIDVLPENTIVLAVPTLASHIRQRGYDHSALVARRFAKLRGLKTASPLLRLNATVQRGASKRLRMEQAQQAFMCRGPLYPDAPYLLIDDIVTTNATLRYAAQSLKDAGARKVWVAVIARQPLDKQA